MKKSFPFAALACIALFGFAALPAHSVSVFLPGAVAPGHNHLIGLILSAHPAATAARLASAGRTLWLTAVPEPTTMMAVGVCLVVLASLLRQRVKKAS